MSGGSYDYVSQKFEQAASDLRSRHPDEPHVLALAEHLDALATVMHRIEWADSGDTTWDERLDDEIRALLSKDAELRIAADRAQKAGDALEGSLSRAHATLANERLRR